MATTTRRHRTSTVEDSSSPTAKAVYCFYTVQPPPYGSGTEGDYLPAHVHVNILVEDDKVLTTQIYFEDDEWLEERPKNPALVRPLEALSENVNRVYMDFVLSSEPAGTDTSEPTGADTATPADR